MLKIDATKFPVMKAHCKTCPFKKNAQGVEQDIDLCNTVTTRTLFKGHQLCHGTNNKTRCKGSFDNNMIIYEAIGVDHLITK